MRCQSGWQKAYAPLFHPVHHSIDRVFNSVLITVAHEIAVHVLAITDVDSQKVMVHGASLLFES